MFIFIEFKLLLMVYQVTLLNNYVSHLSEITYAYLHCSLTTY